MTGNSSNAALWQGADVYIAPAGTTGPTDITTPWATVATGLWSAVGLLSGTNGFVMSRSEQSNEYYAWGGILVRKTTSNHKRTIKFVALEDNTTVFGLINPGSTANTASSLTTSTIVIPQAAPFGIAFELRDGTKVKRRYVKNAQLDTVGDVTESESGLASVEITVVILAEADGTLYKDISGVHT